jgi:hypothetical protein
LEASVLVDILEGLQKSDCAYFGGKWVSNNCLLEKNWSNIDKFKVFIWVYEIPTWRGVWAGLFLPWGNDRFGVLTYTAKNVQPLIYGLVGILLLIPGLIAGCVAASDEE